MTTQITVLSGKGGTGKSSIVSGLAAVVESKIIADCDVDAADLHIVLKPENSHCEDFYSGEIARHDPELCISCGLCLEKCRYQAINDDYSIRKAQCEGCALCAHVCPAGAIAMEERHCGWWYVGDTRFGPLVHARLKTGEENSGKLVTTVRRKAAELAEEQNREFVITDGSPGVGCPVIASLTNTDMALLVTEPSVSGTADLKRAHELIRHFKLPSAVVINKADVHTDNAKAIRAYCWEHSIPVVGEIGYTDMFTRAQLQGISPAEVDNGCHKALFEDIWGNVLAAVRE